MPPELWGKKPLGKRGYMGRRVAGAGFRGVYLFRKLNFQLYHILALLIFSCRPHGQECEFSVVRIKIAPFSCENCVLGQNLHFKGSVWLWRRRKHIVLIRRHCALSNISG